MVLLHLQPGALEYRHRSVGRTGDRMGRKICLQTDRQRIDSGNKEGPIPPTNQKEIGGLGRCALVRLRNHAGAVLDVPTVWVVDNFPDSLAVAVSLPGIQDKRAGDSAWLGSISCDFLGECAAIRGPRRRGRSRRTAAPVE